MFPRLVLSLIVGLTSICLQMNVTATCEEDCFDISGTWESVHEPEDPYMELEIVQVGDTLTGQTKRLNLGPGAWCQDWVWPVTGTIDEDTGSSRLLRRIRNRRTPILLRIHVWTGNGSRAASTVRTKSVARQLHIGKRSGARSSRRASLAWSDKSPPQR
jgi:hypothetical protein